MTFLDRYESYEYALVRDVATDAPTDVVCWRVWMGGSQEVASWPWTAEGLTVAGRELFEVGAVSRRTGFSLCSPDDLLAHAGAR